MGSNCSKWRREDGDTTTFSKNQRRKTGYTEGRIAEGNSLIGGETPCQQSLPSLQSPFSPAYNPRFSLTAEGGSNLCAPVISNNEVGGSINITQNITQNVIQNNDDSSQVAQCTQKSELNGDLFYLSPECRETQSVSRNTHCHPLPPQYEDKDKED